MVWGFGTFRKLVLDTSLDYSRMTPDLLAILTLPDYGRVTGKQLDCPCIISRKKVPFTSTGLFLRSRILQRLASTVRRSRRHGLPPGSMCYPSQQLAVENASEFDRSLNIMAVYRITDALRFLACSLLLCAAIVHGPGTSFAQRADSSSERTSNAGRRSDTLGFSEHARENQQPHA
jgi:hypothetical protein